MTQRTWDANKRFTSKLAEGIDLSTLELTFMEEAKVIHSWAVEWWKRFEFIEARVEEEQPLVCRNCNHQKSLGSYKH